MNSNNFGNINLRNTGNRGDFRGIDNNNGSRHVSLTKNSMSRSYRTNQNDF
jgi:hypothetical protein